MTPAARRVLIWFGGIWVAIAALFSFLPLLFTERYLPKSLGVTPAFLAPFLLISFLINAAPGIIMLAIGINAKEDAPFRQSATLAHYQQEKRQRIAVAPQCSRCGIALPLGKPRYACTDASGKNSFLCAACEKRRQEEKRRKA